MAAHMSSYGYSGNRSSFATVTDATATSQSPHRVPSPRNGNLVRPPLEAGKFNRPHTIAADNDGNLYVTEWLLGGRLTKLARSGELRTSRDRATAD